MKALIVIPARLHSTRLPKKLLLAETGQTLIQHTYQAALTSQQAERVIVAADDQQIVDVVQGFGGQAMLTSPDHTSGTDRVAEVARHYPDFEMIVNVQGDEPELSGEAIDLAIAMLKENPDAQLATLATPIRDENLFHDPNCVKVVVNQSGQALYFSRAPIPFPRQPNPACFQTEPASFLQHVGLYAYRRELLLRFPSLPCPALELLESLEQLRVLNAGIPVQVGVIDHPIPGIDTAEDYSAFVSRQTRR